MLKQIYSALDELGPFIYVKDEKQTPYQRLMNLKLGNSALV